MANDITQYRQIILAPGYDSKTGVFGLVCSADNGQTFKVYWTPYGRVWYPEDASSFFPLLWPYIEEKIKAGGFKQDEVVNWSDIQGKPDVALKSDLPDLSKFAKISDIPKIDLSGYAKITDIPNDLVHTKDLADYVKTKDLPKPLDLSGYALKSQIPSLDGYAKLTDIPSLSGYLKQSALADYAKRSEIPSITGLATKVEAQQAQSTADSATTTADSAKSIAQQAQSTAVDASSKADQALTAAQNAQRKIDSSSQQTSKKPSEYSEGIFHEVKDVSALGIVRDPADFAPEGRQGTIAFVTTMSYGGMAHQTADIVDSEKPMRFCRNGKGDTWYRWEWSTTA